MSVKDLIGMLKTADPDHEVKAFDPNSGQIEGVSGMIFGGNDGIVELTTDDPND